MRLRPSLPLLAGVLVASMLFSGCSGSGKSSRTDAGRPDNADTAMPMPRADPGYLQYLERQTMLTKSSEMAKVVSGSQLAWRSSASIDTPDEMLGYADTWLAVHPLTLLTSSRRPVFEQLNDSAIWPILREAGIKGLYVAPLAGSGNIWAYNSKGDPTGEDIVQYDFAPQAGKDSHYRRLMSSIIDHSTLLGSDLVPAATGIGPDFFLAARSMREYPGAYCMVEVPNSLWGNLPTATSEWETVPLEPTQIAALNSKGILPRAMRDESSPLTRKGGWAATGEVRGIDGNPRRWVYRYYGTPNYAVLNWEDPSQAAHRILSGSAVRQVGLLGQALIGLRFEAFQGLEAAPKNPAEVSSFSIEPALSAAQSMSREIRRYGGWSWLRDDDLPLASINEFLRYGTDYVFDSAFSPAAEHALLTGDATLARFMADELLRLHIDSRRMMHTMPTQDGINYTLPHLSYLASHGHHEEAGTFRESILGAMRAFVSSQTPVPVKDNILYTTAPGLAALAMNLPPADIPKEQWEEVAKGHTLLVFFKAMQPGALMLSGQDLAGALPLHWKSMVDSPEKWNIADTSRGTYALTSAAAGLIVSQQGVARAKQIYPAPDEQVHKEGSFLRTIGAFLRARTQMGIAKGTLTARPETRGRGSIALITQLPGGTSYLLSVCNFTRDTVTENISLASLPKASSLMSHVTSLPGTSQGFEVRETTLTLSLGPWQGKALLIGGNAGTGGTGPKTEANPLAPVIPVPASTPPPVPASTPPPVPASTPPPVPASTPPPAHAAAPLPASTPPPAHAAAPPEAPRSTPSAPPVAEPAAGTNRPETARPVPAEALPPGQHPQDPERTAPEEKKPTSGS